MIVFHNVQNIKNDKAEIVEFVVSIEHAIIASSSSFLFKH